MISFAEIALLALIQGLTEFLPVSSSGHLVLAPVFFEMKDQGILIDVALHVGTLLAILVYYRRDVLAIATGFLFPARTGGDGRLARHLGYCILLGSLPVMAAGLALRVFFPDGIRDVTVIAATMIVFGLLMGLADLYGPRTQKIGALTLRQAFLVGCAQALALIPGTSRSGVTMTAARLLGFDRVDAARFSFLLGIPAMAAAGAVGFLEMAETGDAALWQAAACAVALAFVAGLLAIHFMMVWLKRAGLMPFVVYRMFLGGFLLVYFVL